MSRKKRRAPRIEPVENWCPAKGVVIRSGARRGRIVYGLEEYQVRLCEHYGDLINSYLEREMATAEIREATQGRTPAEVKAIREVLFWRVFKEIEPRLHVESLSASFNADHHKGTNEWLEKTLGRPLIKKLSREVALEKTWETLQPKGKKRGLLFRPKVQNPVAALRDEVHREGQKHRILFGKTRRGKEDPDHREHTLGAKDLDKLEVDHRAAERLVRGGWKRDVVRMDLDAEENPNAGKSPDVAEAEIWKWSGSKPDADQIDLLLWAWSNNQAKNVRERQYLRLVCSGLNGAEAERESGLSHGKAKAFRERLKRRLSSG